MNESLIESAGKIRKMLSVKYEDMVANPKKFITELTQFLEVAPNSFSQDVFNRRLHGAGSAGRLKRSRKILPSDLAEEERALLSRSSIVKVAEAYGYSIEF